MSYKPINDYGIIGNMLSAALVGKDGSIDWCCLPRFDSPSVFAVILDDEKGGKFQIRPRLPFETTQSYIRDTNVLHTTFKTDTATVTVTDFMPCYQTSRGGLTQYPEIHRLVDCTRGKLVMVAIFEPKLDYARDDTSLSMSQGSVIARSKKEVMVLSSSIPLTTHKNTAVSRFTLKLGEKAGFILRYGSDRPLIPVIDNSLNKLEKTTNYWTQQVQDVELIGPWREHIVRSYLVLHLMVYSPSGAIIAAPTTSLPEEIGGERNWDYRYAWLRDASLTINAFSLLGHKEEAIGFMNWLLNVCGKCGSKAQILYDIDSNDPLDEHILDHLRGYRNSKPVRIGNNAYRQLQLDVFGEVLEAAHNYLEIGVYIGHRDWELLESFVNTACELWQQPDSGIWEVR
ncbi:glycoside hydrolase family 15 protein, partial [Chloroflexota bacterium]